MKVSTELIRSSTLVSWGAEALPTETDRKENIKNQVETGWRSKWSWLGKKGVPNQTWHTNLRKNQNFLKISF
jgi:hypothetical protein